MNGQELLTYNSWAVVGDVLNPQKFAYQIFNRLKEEGYNVYPVNPRHNGPEKIYKSLKDIPEKIDVIDLVINPHVGLKVVEEAAGLGIDKVLIQPGAGSPAILDFCRKKGIHAVETCVLVELGKNH